MDRRSCSLAERRWLVIAVLSGPCLPRRREGSARTALRYSSVVPLFLYHARRAAGGWLGRSAQLPLPPPEPASFTVLPLRLAAAMGRRQAVLRSCAASPFLHQQRADEVPLFAGSASTKFIQGALRLTRPCAAAFQRHSTYVRPAPSDMASQM